jgi:3-oxoacyl-[acyl-carrier protein] reductase
MGLAREGAQVAICARGADVLERTAKEIMATTGAEVFWRSADMAKAEDIQRVIDDTRAR